MLGMLAAVIVYTSVLLAISVVLAFRVRSQEDFMVAGRAVPAWVLAGTLVCTWTGSGSLFGGAGLAFREGFFQLWSAAGAVAGIAVIYFLAPRVRRIADYTLPDLLEKRYHPAARLLGTATIVVAYVVISGYQFKGGGRLLAILTDGTISPGVGAMITAATVVLITLLAGMVSIVSLDIVNGLLMLAGIAAALPLALRAAGGWETVHEILPAENFSPLGRNSLSSAVGYALPVFLLLLGESSVYQKFFSARSAQAAGRAAAGMLLGVALIEVMMCTLSVIGGAIYWRTIPRLSDGAFAESAKAQTEEVILRLAQEQVGPICGALLLCAAVAIILSTANTFLMTPATSLTRDVFQRFIRPRAGGRTLIAVQRLLIVALGGAALLLSTRFQSILSMAYFAYVMVGAAITPVLLAAFLSKRVTPAAGVASIAGGMITTLVARFGLSIESDAMIYPAIGVSLLLLVGISAASPPPDERYWRPFFEKPNPPPPA